MLCKDGNPPSGPSGQVPEAPVVPVSQSISPSVITAFHVIKEVTGRDDRRDAVPTTSPPPPAPLFDHLVFSRVFVRVWHEFCPLTSAILLLRRRGVGPDIDHYERPC